MIEKTSKITGLIPIKYSELTKEEKEISTDVHSESLNSFNDSEFDRVLNTCELLNSKISEGYNHFIEQDVICALRHSFLELPEESHNSKRCLFVQPDTVQPVEKYGIIMYKYILQLRLDKRIAK